MWDFSRYNVLVQQVEGVSDLLHDVAARIRPVVDTDEIAGLLLWHVERAAAGLDRRALRMLALYDPAALEMVRDGTKRDPRRAAVPHPTGLRPRVEKRTHRKNPARISLPAPGGAS